MNRQDVKGERGASLVEYALLVGAIAMVAIGGLSQVGGGVDERFTETGDALQTVNASSPTDDVEEEAEGEVEGEAQEPTAPGGDATGGGGGSGEGGSGGGGEEPVPTEDDGAAPDEDEGADPPDDEGSDTDPLGEAGESGGIPGDSTDPDPDPVDDGDGGDNGGDGAGSDGDANDEVSESVGLFGEFSVVFKVVDGKVVIGSVASYGWEYKIQQDTGTKIRMKFTNGQQGKNLKIVFVTAWLTKDGKLETSLED
ncbi:MAG TPA: Flp family type IVb pilin [Acidimicrobiia bacterium]|nr:Flp family type IVb pilin [Acidimicrobiia bacterium]